MQYQEIVIRLRGTSGGRFIAQVVDAPCDGRPGHEFDLPLSEQELEDFSKRLMRQIARVEGRDGGDKGDPDDTPPVTATRVGKALFKAVFAGEIGKLYDKCQDEVPPDQGLRIRLVFDPKATQGSEDLSELPWELIYDPRRRRFVARQRRRPVVRDLDWGTAPTAAAVRIEPPLRILVVDAAPRGIRKLDLQSEWERIDAALAPLELAGEVEIHWADTLERMRVRLLDERIHVLHFMGHGGYRESSGLGALYFESPSGDLDQVDGDELGEFLDDLNHLGLVVLNSCSGARYSGAKGRPAHYGVASGVLQRASLPAVVAMQHTISDPAAISFAGRFYKRLAMGDPVDTAISEARLVMSQESPEWATPVLFMTAKEGVVFDVDRDGAHPPQRKRLRPRTLGIRSFQVKPEDDLGRNLPHITDADVDLRDSFQGRYIKEDRLWLDEVFPKLRQFLDRMTRGPRPVELRFAAHTTVGYAVGWLLQDKTGLEVAVYQPTKDRGIQRWSADDGSAPAADEPLWENDEPVELPGGGPDVAVALAASRPIRDQVEAYIREKNLPVGRLLDAEIAGGAGQSEIGGGAHAQVLAQSLANRIAALPRERGSRLHLFASAPLALVFSLGQLGRPFGQMVLYEHAFEAADSYARYRPSLVLPPPGEGFDPPPGW